jgi:Galactose oxidase, central domain/Kelch motif
MSAPTALAELYDPATGTFSATGSMAHARFNHTATLLPNGKVLIAGGEQGYTDVQPLSSAELYDPATGKFSATGSMSHIRTWSTATLLPNGKVFITGGLDGAGALSSAELYDPATGQFGTTGSMSIGRESHTATPLDNGKVLLAGGLSYKGFPSGEQSSAELYDPATGEFTPTGSMHVGRYGAVAISLRDGRVLFAGGDSIDCTTTSAEIYDPATGTFSLGGSLANASMDPQAALLRDGRVLIVGGWVWGGDGLSTAQVFDPTTGTFSPTGSLSTARPHGTAVSLANGRVLVVGGVTSTGFLASAEVYTP